MGMGRWLFLYLALVKLYRIEKVRCMNRSASGVRSLLRLLTPMKMVYPDVFSMWKPSRAGPSNDVTVFLNESGRRPVVTTFTTSVRTPLVCVATPVWWQSEMVQELGLRRCRLWKSLLVLLV